MCVVKSSSWTQEEADPQQVFWLTEKLVYSIIKNGMKDYIAPQNKTDLGGSGKGNNFSLSQL